MEDLSHATQKNPWGPASHEALRRALSIASRLGLDAHDCEGYLGYADVTGSSEDYLATIAHCDVVPEGLGWTVEPFDVTHKDAYLVGRGVLDDKGPLVLSLYAAHFFAREVERTGRRLPLTLRAIIGSEEETGMGDVSYYLDHYPSPASSSHPTPTSLSSVARRASCRVTSVLTLSSAWRRAVSSAWRAERSRMPSVALRALW